MQKTYRLMKNVFTFFTFFGDMVQVTTDDVVYELSFGGNGGE